ncbi:dihydrolipoyllysine-residue acetyltransferase component of pyruvate dehydrogenase complex, mitochondrial-like [Chelonus insularis]|uniref:dihydrolipoyllysine-residue acetyltransferase component of pyruvate dehydrogenase complex, mitochondrial-like n=1 Tax=Chelonus insularis TaxID=460826 RepID=UPI00158ADE1B|nr:dihydrolipoyllysine-residue acetyltransferase component of pyruvate dehydrogenase complex, mitochondrial-like [Chelonus insularis]XP_034951969.1 dihydrolipoyllysine-residue acetyltransferase component of pyruvate dehydrogenase complex, mitochondrial-like [Chelonus insularis]
MAQMMRCRVNLSTLKNSYNLVSRIVLPVKYQRSCFHTSWLLNVKGKEILMPSLSPTMETGTIVKWIKKEGDPIQPGDALADIQTDKAVMTFEIEEESILAKIIVPEGTKDIKVGTLIALSVEPDEDWKSVEMPDGAGASTSPASSSAAPAESAGVSAEAAEPPPGQVNVAMPALSPTMTSGTIVKWLKKEGDEINPGDAVAEIQTDKAVMTFEMDEEAILAKLLVEEGAQVEVGQLIAVTVEKGMDWKSAVIPTATKPAAKASSSAAAPAPAAKSSSAAPRGGQPPPSGQVYGLAVKRLLEEYGLSSGSIKGTGRPNRLLKSDVLNYIQTNNIQRVPPKSADEPSKTAVGAPSPASKATTQARAPPKSGPSTYKDLEVSNIRAVIAKRLGESKSVIPHSYATVDINIDKLNELRGNLKAENVKVSVNDFVTKAVAHALLQCPDVNTLYQNGQIVRMQNIDVSVAVSTPSGLITPIVFNTTAKSITEISNDVKTLAGKAREGTLKPNEFQGGTFTISNLGMFGIKEFSAIINPPQTAILAVGTGRDVLDTTLRKKSMMTATLSYDSRAIDEDQAANFLSILRSMLEDPSFLVINKGQQAMRHKRE